MVTRERRKTHVVRCLFAMCVIGNLLHKKNNVLGAVHIDTYLAI